MKLKWREIYRFSHISWYIQCPAPADFLHACHRSPTLISLSFPWNIDWRSKPSVYCNSSRMNCKRKVLHQLHLWHLNSCDRQTLILIKISSYNLCYIFQITDIKTVLIETDREHGSMLFDYILYSGIKQFF